MNKQTNKDFSDKNKIGYLAKDFSGLKNNMLELIKSYYPSTYRDFKDGSAGMMFVDTVAAVGDILSFYTDYQFSESFIGSVTERQNIIKLAKSMGYKPMASRPASTVLDVFQIVPSTTDEHGNFVPDYTFALAINENMIVSSNNGVKFRTTAPVDFSITTPSNSIEVSAFNRNQSNEIETFLLKKQVEVSAGEIVTETFQINSSQEFYKLSLSRTDVIEVLSVIDSDGYRWYEVDNLVQDVVITDHQNTQSNNKELSRHRASAPFLLTSLRTDRKFVSYIDDTNKTTLEFGSGENTNIQDRTISNIKDISLNRGVNSISIDPTNFIDGPSFGLKPSINTALTVEYIAGGGIESNIGANELTNILRVEYSQSIDGFTNNEQSLIRQLRKSVKVTNEEGASGGKGIESDTEIKQNALAFMNSQNRIVTAEDYMVRSRSMPKKYGSIAKSFAVSDDFLRENSTSHGDSKTFAVNLFVLGFDTNKNLTGLNEAVRKNLIEYLRPYRMMTDDIVIKNGNVVNVGINYEIVSFAGENRQLLMFNCNEVIKSFFEIDKWEFNQPIYLNSLMLAIGNVSGVRSVSKVEVINKTREVGDYSISKYNIETATKNGIVFPSVDPCIFELKYPDMDISGKCI